MGYGKRWTYKTSKEDEATPGPAYDSHLNNTIMMTLSKMGKKKNSTFGSTYDKYEGIVHKGQERHFLGKFGAGPGAYSTIDKASK